MANSAKGVRRARKTSAGEQVQKHRGSKQGSKTGAIGGNLKSNLGRRSASRQARDAKGRFA